MRRPAFVHDDGTGSALAQREVAGSELALEACAVGGSIPGREAAITNVRERDAGAGFDEALLRGDGRDRAVGINQAVGRHPLDDVVPAFGGEPVSDGAGVRRRRRLQA